MKVCSVEGCGNKNLSKGYCNKHYTRFLRYGDPLTVKQIQNHDNVGNCKVEECEEKHYGSGYCIKHYTRIRRHGNPLKECGGLCIIEGCSSVHFGKGYCRTHYTRLRKYGDPLTIKRYVDLNRKCSVEGCEEKYLASGFCNNHYVKFNKKFSNKHYYTSEYQKEHFYKRRSLKRNAIINDLTAADLRESIKHFNNECAYCGCTDKKIHADHVVPLSKGGSNTITNIIPACKECNLKKHAKLIEKWYPNQSCYSKQRETKIYKWMGYKVHKDVLQATLF